MRDKTITVPWNAWNGMEWNNHHGVIQNTPMHTPTYGTIISNYSYLTLLLLYSVWKYDMNKLYLAIHHQFTPSFYFSPKRIRTHRRCYISRIHAPKQTLREMCGDMPFKSCKHQPCYTLGTAAHLCGLTWVLTTDAVRILRFNFIMTTLNTQNQFHMNTFFNQCRTLCDLHFVHFISMAHLKSSSTHFSFGSIGKFH